MVSLPILILAAGASRRMRGADKLLIPVDGEALLARTARQAVASEAAVFVTLPEVKGDRADVLKDLPVTLIGVPDADLGMSHSLRAGIAALPEDAPGVLVMLADMPAVTTADLLLFYNAFEGEPEHIYRATSESGHHGHPVVFPRDLFGEFEALEGDEGARRVISAHLARLRLLPLPEGHATTDLDTPEDWTRWRQVHPT